MTADLDALISRVEEGAGEDRELDGLLLAASPASTPGGHVEIAHDGFAGHIIGRYETREGKRGVVVQQDGTRVVHVYGEKWLSASPAPASAPGSGVRVRPLEWKQPEPDWWEVYDRTLQLGYEVNQRRDGSVRLRVPGETSFAIFAGSVEEAKAAAQADFEQRIRSALDASPSPPETREAVETEREACARVAEDKANTKDFRARMVIAAAIRARGQS